MEEREREILENITMWKKDALWIRSKFQETIYFCKTVGISKKNVTNTQTVSSVENDVEVPKDTSPIQSPLPYGKPSTRKRNQSQTSSFEQELLKKLDTPAEEQSTHVAFIKSIEPALKLLNEDEVLEWQHSAIEALLSIKKRKIYQTPMYLSGQQASSSFSQIYNWQNPPKNVTDPMGRAPNVHNNYYNQTCPQTTIPLPSPVNSISSEVSELLDI